MMNRGGKRKIYDEPESPNEGACLKAVMNRNRQMRGRVSDINGEIFDEPQSRNEGMHLRCMGIHDIYIYIYIYVHMVYIYIHIHVYIYISIRIYIYI